MYSTGLNKTSQRKAELESESCKLAKTIAVTRDISKGLDGTVAEVNSGLGQLPVVVGRSISTVPGILYLFIDDVCCLFCLYAY